MDTLKNYTTNEKNLENNIMFNGGNNKLQFNALSVRY